jgi:prepilin-type N-terminal cleavage/methylation domain-containing protein
MKIANLLAKKGFTLVETLITLAICTLLSAIAIPGYMNYVNQARLIQLVLPGIHSVETNVMIHYAIKQKFPDPIMLPILMENADTNYFNVAIGDNLLTFTIDAPTNTSKLSQLHGQELQAQPTIKNKKIVVWNLTGTLAEKLSINN